MAAPKEEANVANEAGPAPVVTQAAATPVANDQASKASTDAAVVSTPVVNEKKDMTPKKSKMDLSKAPVRQYLDVTVVPYLLKGLSNLARERPANPLEYLANFLLDKAKEEAAAANAE